MSEKTIPDLILATVRMHAAKTEMDLVRVKDELDRTTVSTARSRVLRGLREQLTAQAEAWAYLAVVAGSGHYQAYSEVNDVPANVVAYRGDNPESWWCREHQPAVYFTGEVTDRDEIEEGAECFQCGKGLAPGAHQTRQGHWG